jgi:hypothetical protein
MSQAKEIVMRLLNNLPDDCTLEDIQYHLHAIQKIQKGLQDIKDGNTYTQQQAEARLAKFIIE